MNVEFTNNWTSCILAECRIEFFSIYWQLDGVYHNIISIEILNFKIELWWDKK